MSFPKHFSTSMIELWIRCPACWALRYEKKDKSFNTSGSLFFGRCMSEALEAIHNQLNSDPLNAAKLKFIQAYERQCEIGMEPRPGLDHGLLLLDEYAEKGIFKGVPEFKFKVDIKGLDLPLLGYMDLLLEDETGPYGIAEFKTSSGKWDQERVDHELQGILYWCSFWSLFRKLPNPFNYVIMRTDVPRVDVFPAKYSRETCLDTLDLLRRIFSELEIAHSENGVFPGYCKVHKDKRISLLTKPKNPSILL